MAGGTIRAGSSIHIDYTFTYGDEVSKASDSVLRSIHVEPSGVDFIVGNEDVTKASTALSYAEYEITIPASACP